MRWFTVQRHVQFVWAPFSWRNDKVRFLSPNTFCRCISHRNFYLKEENELLYWQYKLYSRSLNGISDLSAWACSINHRIYSHILYMYSKLMCDDIFLSSVDIIRWSRWSEFTFKSKQELGWKGTLFLKGWESLKSLWNFIEEMVVEIPPSGV